ncbi:MAG: acyl-CoA carboxylase subunit beta [Clostridia bacterium]|nr:acyl-CoA carboxylase subunit beta [Clostridia bacterium]
MRADFIEQRKRALEGSGESGKAKQHEKGKLTARERIELLFDEGSFVETGLFVESQISDFGMDDKKFPTDGVITGYGTVYGRFVCAASQDFTFMGGALGEKNGEKVSALMDHAYKNGTPFVSLNDSGGARVQEGVRSLKGYGDIFYRNARYSGVIPQISAIMGPCAGGAVYSPAITDFTFMVNKTSYMCITGTSVIKAVTGEDVTIEKLGGANVHNQTSGVAHFKCESDEDCIKSIRRLLSYIPSNNKEKAPSTYYNRLVINQVKELDILIPDDNNKPYDMKILIDRTFDRNSFLEVQKDYAPNIIVGFAKLMGETIGIVANQPAYMAGCLDYNSSDKAARFVRFCDSFNIPLISFTDVPGYLPGVPQEHNGIIRHGAKMLYAFAEATVPKINIIVRKAFGGAYVAMNSMHLGADFVFAWPNAEIAVMGAEGAANVIHAREIKSSSSPEQTRKEKVEEYKDKLCNPYVAAKLGYITDVIAPHDTRIKLAKSLEFLRNKSESLPSKKHGNIPL